jgi:molybdopterin-synthase adenylyltransferase
MKALSPQELERYRRQIMLPGFSEEHQERLKNSCALIAGIGGLGGTTALYLAVAGIGRMVFAHYGDLTLTNMNRQVLMRHEAIGSSRVVEGRKTIIEINPDVEIETVDARTTEENVDELLKNVDIAVSARPNFHERRALNKGCVERRKTMIEAAMCGMAGYIFNIIPGETACLNCVFPDDDPSWEERGFPVLGAVSGLIGCLAAIEAIKLLTGYGKPLLSTMLHADTAGMNFRKAKIERAMDCIVCGKTGNHVSCNETEGACIENGGHEVSRSK